MDCLIIAAGLGSRLGDRALPKPLVPVGGVPLIERAVSQAARAGATAFHVVIGHRGEELRAFLTDLAGRLGLLIRCIENPDWGRPNGMSVLAAEPHLPGRFLLTMSDHLAEPALPAGLLASPPEEGSIVLAVDRDLANPLVDLEDVTRVQLRGDRVTGIGKELEPYHGFDTGFFLAGPALFEALRESARLGDESLSGGVRVLAEGGRVLAHDATGRLWLDVDDPDALARAGELVRTGCV